MKLIKATTANPIFDHFCSTPNLSRFIGRNCSFKKKDPESANSNSKQKTDGRSKTATYSQRQ